jgi:hypothetical protein
MSGSNNIVKSKLNLIEKPTIKKDNEKKSEKEYF